MGCKENIIFFGLLPSAAFPVCAQHLSGPFDVHLHKAVMAVLSPLMAALGEESGKKANQ